MESSHAQTDPELHRSASECSSSHTLQNNKRKIGGNGRNVVVFLCQVLVLFTVVVFSLYNLSAGGDQNTLWASLLNASLFAMLPAPSIRDKKQNECTPFISNVER
jgi:hypothetical protein